MAVISLINPAKAAKAATAKQYGALIGALNQNLTNLKAQNAQNLTDISDWYGTAANAQQQSAQQDQAAAASSQTEHDNAVQAVLHALGGNSDAAGMIGSQAVSSGDLMQNLAANRSNEDTQSLANLHATQANALVSQRNAGTTALQGLRSQLQSTLKEKGAAYTTNLDAARQERLQQAAELQNMRLAGKQFGLNKQIAQAQIGNTNASTAALVKQLHQTAPGAQKTEWKYVQPADREHLAATIGQSMYTKGGAALSPKNAWNNAMRALAAENPQWNARQNKNVRGWLSKQWLSYVNDYNLQHPGNHYKPAKNGTPYGAQYWMNIVTKREQKGQGTAPGQGRGIG